MNLTLNPNDHIEVTDPDDPKGMPAYGGPIENAHRHLEPGIYTAYAHGDNGEEGPAVLAVTETTATATWEPYHCNACGRDELTCSLDPCPDVIADRES